MRYEFFKIIDPTFVQSFREGNRYMNSLNFFRRLEEDAKKSGNKAQKDPMEGTCGTIHKNHLRQFGFHFDENLLNLMGNHVLLLSDNYGYNNLFCLYRLKIDDDNKMIQRPSQQLVDFNDEDKSTKVVIRFHDSEEFLRRLEAALQTALREQNFEYAIYGGVNYENVWVNADGPGTRSAFHKGVSYAYQEEWRLCILSREWVDQAVTFPIGDLEEICEVVSLDQFLNHLDLIYPGYTLVEHLDDPRQETYHMFGKINAVNRLMYAYMPQRIEKPTRSDETEADWHYTQFLNLSGRQQEIDPYLESRLHHYKDIEHMELLAQYRLSQERWVEATDAFAFILQNAPEQIKKEPARFYFQLHTILMQHQEPADAAKFLEIATSKYDFPEELAKIMRGDCLMALGFYDQVVGLFEELQQESSDPILEYYLAVSTFHLLRFEEAERHLQTYIRFFSQSHTVAHKVNDLHKLIECFRTHTPLDEVSKEHPFLGLKWTKQIENVLQQARDSGRGVYLSIDAFYQIEVSQKWDLVADITSITVIPLTIAKIIDLYRVTGAPVFYQIIEHLATMKNVIIQSPDLKFYLAVDIKSPELPSHYKMERALMIQESNPCL